MIHRRPPATAAPRIPAGRRAIVGAAWALAWMALWASALLVFATKTHAAPLSLAVSDGTVSLPVYVAQAQGFFGDEGLAPRFVSCRSGRDCYRMLGDGAVDVATAADMVVATDRAPRRDVVIIATISASASQIKIVARRGPQLAEAPQLSGKRVALVVGSSAQFFLDNWLVFNDIDPRGVTLVPRPTDRIVAALLAREVDAIAIWEPLASIAAAQLGGEGLVFASPRVYTQHFNLVTDRAVSSRRAPELTQLLRALVRAQHFIADQPEAARALLVARTGLAPALAASAVAGQDFRIRLDQSLVTTMQSQARWAVRAGLYGPGDTRRGVDLLRVIEPGPLRQVDPAAVGLVR